MQFGIFTVGDVTTDPTTGRTVSEHRRIKNTVEMAKVADEVGLDVGHDPSEMVGCSYWARVPWPRKPRRS